MTISLDGHGPSVLHITPELDATGTVLQLAGEMDVATAGHLTDVLRALPAANLSSVRLDLTGLAFIDASGLSALLEASALVGRHGGLLTLDGARPLLVRLLDITELAAVFQKANAHPRD